LHSYWPKKTAELYIMYRFCLTRKGSHTEHPEAGSHVNTRQGATVNTGKEGALNAAAGPIDRLDARLIGLLAAEPRVGVLEASRRLGVARGTVQARLDRLQARGVVTGYGPDVDPVALGYRVTGFVTLEIRQVGGHDPVAERLAGIPEVLEVHTITGPGDMLCRVVARTNADLQRVIDAIVAVAGVVRASTVIALAAPVPYRVLPLVRVSASAARD
jgi:DNA-binding Lrp family transcriptional regulator